MKIQIVVLKILGGHLLLLRCLLLSKFEFGIYVLIIQPSFIITKNGAIRTVSGVGQHVSLSKGEGQDYNVK